MSDFILYTHTDPSIDNLTDFLSAKSIYPVGDIEGGREKFLQYDVLGKTNLDCMFFAYDKEEQEYYRDAYLSGNLEYLKLNTVLAIPKDENLNIEKYGVFTRNQDVQSRTFEAFYADKLKELYTDKRYTINKDFTTQANAYANIVMYLRSINKFIDVTKFVTRVSTSNSENGGNFSIELAPVIDIDNYTNNTIRDYYYNRNESYFSKNIQQNDLIFIRYERLDNDTNYNIFDNGVAGGIYDLIGLVDSVNTNTKESNVSIVVSGRDFIKLLIEDSCYFAPLMFGTNILLNPQDDKKIFYRLLGRYNLLLLSTFRSISQSVKFILNQLSNTGIVNNNVFIDYGTRRSMVVRRKDGSVLTQKNSQKDKFKFDSPEYRAQEKKELVADTYETLSEGVWQIIKVLIDENIADRFISDTSISQPEGSLLNQINKLCQKPFIEFFSDTYGDEFTFIVRQPPFTQKAILNSIENGIVIDLYDTNIYEDNLIINESEIYSWFQLEPKGSLFGTLNSTGLATIPAFYIPQYANIWGNRIRHDISNYIPSNSYIGSKQKENTSSILNHVYDDYAYILEIYACNPFLKSGTVIIAGGDRRFKRGTFVRLVNRGEIYYIDAVSNEISVNANGINRTTTLSLIRGMKEKYIKGVNVNGVNMSYFNLLDLNYITEILRSRTSKKGNLNIRKDLGINDSVIDYFLKGKHNE